MAIVKQSTLGDSYGATVDADPTSTSHDLPKGSLLIFGALIYCKNDDGDTTNVSQLTDTNLLIKMAWAKLG